jgi:metal-responsive CopG/Arc/MetJ family transcriptional regulator
MADDLERVRRQEHRTRSELVREALRHYMRGAEIRAMRDRIAKLPEQQPTADEIAAINASSREFGEGDFINLNQLHHDLDHRGRQPRARKSQARSRR